MTDEFFIFTKVQTSHLQCVPKIWRVNYKTSFTKAFLFWHELQHIHSQVTETSMCQIQTSNRQAGWGGGENSTTLSGAREVNHESSIQYKLSSVIDITSKSLRSAETWYFGIHMIQRFPLDQISKAGPWKKYWHLLTRTSSLESHFQLRLNFDLMHCVRLFLIKSSLFSPSVLNAISCRIQKRDASGSREGCRSTSFSWLGFLCRRF